MLNHVKKANAAVFLFLVLSTCLGWVYRNSIVSFISPSPLAEVAQADKSKANKPQDKSQTPPPQADKKSRFTVTVERVIQQPYRAVHSYNGISEAKSIIDLRAQTAGQIVQTPAEKGSRVKKGAVLCKIEDGGRSATLAQSKANLAKAQNDFDIANKLVKKGVAASMTVIRRRADLATARTTQIKSKLDFERTQIRAPSKGVISDLPAKTGSFLNVGDLCAKFVELDPLLIVAQVPEKDIHLFTPAMKATAQFITGETVLGDIVYIAPNSDPQTRTFRVELEITNKSYALKSGVSAKLMIEQDKQDALLIAQRLIALNSEGVLGVYSVSETHEVQFMPIQILAETQKGFWVKAAFKSPLLITEGQNYVSVGETVSIDQPTKNNQLSRDLSDAK